MANQNPEQHVRLGEGEFRGRPIESEMTSSTKGKTQYAVRFLLLEGPDSGKTISWWGGFEGDGFDYTTKALVALGWDKKLPLSKFKAVNEVRLVLKHDTIPATDTKPARPTTRVKFINSLDGSFAATKMSDAEKEAASAAIMARLGQSQGTPETPNFGDKASDDEIPF